MQSRKEIVGTEFGDAEVLIEVGGVLFPNFFFCGSVPRKLGNLGTPDVE